MKPFLPEVGMCEVQHSTHLVDKAPHDLIADLRAKPEPRREPESLLDGGLGAVQVILHQAGQS